MDRGQGNVLNGAKGFLFRTYAETKLYSIQDDICTTYDEERRNTMEMNYRSKGCAAAVESGCRKWARRSSCETGSKRADLDRRDGM